MRYRGISTFVLFGLAASFCSVVLAGPPTGGLHIWLDGQDPDGDGFTWAKPGDGDTVYTWYDKATADGSQDAAQYAGRLPPVYASDQTNGMGALDFTQPGTNMLAFTPVLVGDQARTFFVVAKGRAGVVHRRTNAAGGNYGLFDYGADRLFGGWSDGGAGQGLSPAIDPNAYHLGSYLMQTDGTFVFDSGTANWSDTKTFLDAPISAHYLGVQTQNNDLDPLIAEVILYTNAVPYVTQVLVENYLAAKYGFTLPAVKEVYQGDTAGNGDFDQDVLGIGRESNVTVSAASDAGLTLSDSGTSLDANGEFVLAGHATPINSRTTSDVPAGSMTRRWNRVWYVDATGTVNVVVTFDFSDAGLPAPAGGTDFALLRSATRSPYAFTDLGLAESVNGDAVSFTVTAISDGYYTLATDETLPAVTTADDQGGLPATDLHVWLNASDIDGDLQSTNNPANGASVTTWYDAATADGSQNAIKNGNASAPVYAANALNSMGVVDFPGVNDALYFVPGYTEGEKTFFLVAKENCALSHKFTSNNQPGSYVLFYYNSDNLLSYRADDDSVNTSPIVDDSTYHIASYRFETGGTYLYDGGELSYVNPKTCLVQMSNHVLGNRTYQGTLDYDPTIAEVIMYSNAVSTAQRMLVENYLSAKYDQDIGGTDRYAGDEATKGDYDYDVFGIGGDVTANARHGLGLAAPWLGDGQFVIGGHKVITNSVVDSSAEGISGERWERVWYVDVTGDPDDIQLSFDLSEGGIAGDPTAHTDLFYSSSSTFAWSRLVTGGTVNGDRVVFAVPSASLLDGYYTLGQFIPRGTVISVK